MRPKPYIGITGFMTQGEVEGVLDVLPIGTDQLVMIGVLASNKTLRGEENKWPKRYPKPETLETIFPSSSDLNSLNLIHFNTNESPVGLFREMCGAQVLAGPHCHGFQLNVVWPYTRALYQYKRYTSFARKTIVLQCGNKALSECEWSPKEIAKRVRGYEGLVDYVLIDPSGGLGKEFDPEFAKACFHELQKIETMGFGVAGGLHAGNLHRLYSLIEEFPDFSIDAEGKLRTVEDDLDVEAAKAYLKAAYNKFHEYRVAV